MGEMIFSSYLDLISLASHGVLNSSFTCAQFYLTEVVQEAVGEAARNGG